MKTLNEIQKIADLDARIISASALLEFELRQAIVPAGNETLGGLVHMFEPFKAGQFIRNVKFALGVRNAIAHWTPRFKHTQEEKTTAADFLTRAVHMVQLKNGTAESAPLPQRPTLSKRSQLPERTQLPARTSLPERAPLPETASGSRVSVIVWGLNLVVLIVLAFVVVYGIGLFETVGHHLKHTPQASPGKDTLIQSGQTPIIRPAKRKST
jgi:hypothetical protein